MKTKFDIKSLALGVLLGAVALFSIAAATKQSPTWEYKFLYQITAPNRNLAEAINTASIEGWEVVNYAPTPESGQTALLKRLKK